MPKLQRLQVGEIKLSREADQTPASLFFNLLLTNRKENKMKKQTTTKTTSATSRSSVIKKTGDRLVLGNHKANALLKDLPKDKYRAAAEIVSMKIDDILKLTPALKKLKPYRKDLTVHRSHGVDIVLHYHAQTRKELDKFLQKECAHSVMPAILITLQNLAKSDPHEVSTASEWLPRVEIDIVYYGVAVAHQTTILNRYYIPEIKNLTIGLRASIPLSSFYETRAGYMQHVKQWEKYPGNPHPERAKILKKFAKILWKE